MSMDKYVKALETLPQIVGIYEDTFKDYVSNHKCHFFWFRWRIRWKLEKEERKSLNYYFEYLDTLKNNIPQIKKEEGSSTETKEEKTKNRESELEELFSNLSATDNKQKPPTPPSKTCKQAAPTESAKDNKQITMTEHPQNNKRSLSENKNY